MSKKYDVDTRYFIGKFAKVGKECKLQELCNAAGFSLFALDETTGKLDIVFSNTDKKLNENWEYQEHEERTVKKMAYSR